MHTKIESRLLALSEAKQAIHCVGKVLLGLAARR